MKRKIAMFLLAIMLGLGIAGSTFAGWSNATYADQPPGLRGYEGQPGNQGGNQGDGLKGYEGQPGNQGGGKHNP